MWSWKLPGRVGWQKPSCQEINQSNAQTCTVSWFSYQENSKQKKRGALARQRVDKADPMVQTSKKMGSQEHCFNRTPSPPAQKTMLPKKPATFSSLQGWYLTGRTASKDINGPTKRKNMAERTPDMCVLIKTNY